MSLSPDVCYRALASKDARFDGRFFTGVLTTGVYCRPVCPARVPARRNVRFFPSAAAAEAEGFRPCLRCRPEASPGTPAWLGTSVTVSRALRHIAAGVLDEGHVEALADRLGVGERHLRRLFVEHLGAPPLAIAQTRRVQLAKKLIDETTLPMSHIALDAGFPSVRRFNEAVRKAYGRTPTQLRRRRALARGGSASPIVLRLAYRPPLDWPRLVAYLEARAIPGVEHVERGVYRRAVRAGDVTGVVEVVPARDRPELLLKVPFDFSRHLLSLVERARRLFDLGADPGEIVGALKRDRVLALRLGRRRDVRVPGAWDAFETTVRAILGQQVTVRGASTLAGRVARAFGAPIAVPSLGLTHVFPDAAALARADLVRVGLPGARASAIHHLAREVASGRLRLGDGPPEATLDRLTALPGIGPWTAQYVAMRVLGEPDAFPAGDLGLRQALREGSRLPTLSALERRSRAWRPWRAYAAMAIWTS